ncbi:hypothetical protein PHJA_000382200 [Phtheirospermum japonicum]|uniref:Uncharacterized protein n=1 Tax=Phtheirospermum japonicum TaxID=374723 RepID=A0A830BJY0_9LAMI|nr:hypothetical protein PHJA_000382200 [Phtheirospermum japonicum]
MIKTYINHITSYLFSRDFARFFVLMLVSGTIMTEAKEEASGRRRRGGAVLKCLFNVNPAARMVADPIYFRLCWCASCVFFWCMVCLFDACTSRCNNLYLEKYIGMGENYYDTRRCIINSNTVTSPIDFSIRVEVLCP